MFDILISIEFLYELLPCMIARYVKHDRDYFRHFPHVPNRALIL